MTALLAWMFFGDTLNLREVVGLVVAVVGVAVATGVLRRDGSRPEVVTSEAARTP